jgi:hypothetical protein
MADDTTTKILWGAVIAAITGLYAFFLKHIIRHVDKDELIKLKEGVQYKDNCGEIVKRLDGNFEQLNSKLDTILGHVEKK